MHHVLAVYTEFKECQGKRSAVTAMIGLVGILPFHRSTDMKIFAQEIPAWYNIPLINLGVLNKGFSFDCHITAYECDFKVDIGVSKSIILSFHLPPCLHFCFS